MTSASRSPPRPLPGPAKGSRAMILGMSGLAAATWGHHGAPSSRLGRGRTPTVASWLRTASMTRRTDSCPVMGVKDPYWSRARSQYPQVSAGMWTATENGPSKDNVATISSRHMRISSRLGNGPSWRDARRYRISASRAGRILTLCPRLMSRTFSTTVVRRMIRSWRVSSMASISRRNASSDLSALIMGSRCEISGDGRGRDKGGIVILAWTPKIKENIDTPGRDS